MIGRLREIRRICSRFLAAALLCISWGSLLAACERGRAASDSPSPFVSSLVPHKFGRYEYQINWLGSSASDLSLGINTGDFKDTNFGTRIHEFETVPIEHSCYPDDVVYARRGDSVDVAYAGYLVWSGRTEIEDGREARSIYTRKASDGLLSRYIEPEILATMQEIRADMTVAHSLVAGDKLVRTKVTITNRYSEPAHFYWIHQDAVVLNLSDGDQKGVRPVTSRSEGIYEILRGSADAWVGSFHSASRAASILYSPDASYLFTMHRYVGVRGFPVTDCAAKGFDCRLGGNDRFVARSRIAPDLRLKKLSETPLREVSESSLKVHGLMMDLGELLPGETRSARFVRLAVREARSIEALRAEVDTALAVAR